MLTDRSAVPINWSRVFKKAYVYFLYIRTPFDVIMAKLTMADQQKIKKMSDEHLRTKLVEAGYSQDDTDLMEREELLGLFAGLWSQTQTRASVSEQGTTAMHNFPPVVVLVVMCRIPHR